MKKPMPSGRVGVGQLAGLISLGMLLAGWSLLAQAPAPAGGGTESNAWMEAAPTSTGIAIGQKIPAFRLPDQNGRQQDFDSIKGPKGAVIYFNRSVDW